MQELSEEELAKVAGGNRYTDDFALDPFTCTRVGVGTNTKKEKLG
jgi:bacteriocin-like protein